MTSAARNRELLATAQRRPPEDRPGTLDAAAARQALDDDLIAMRAAENRAPTPLAPKAPPEVT
jgi:hypothetical protein